MDGRTGLANTLSVDKQIGAYLDSYDAEGQEYTVLYFASPHEPPRNYESEFDHAMPMELRRRMDGGVLERADGGQGSANLPLFAKYQFFTPGMSFPPSFGLSGNHAVSGSPRAANKRTGLFMAFLGALIMFAMLWAGLSAVASLQVSYGAFDKEMGPAAQKKAQ